MPRWEMASSSLWVTACWMALGSWSGRTRMSLNAERGADRSEGCSGWGAKGPKGHRGQETHGTLQAASPAMTVGTDELN